MTANWRITSILLLLLTAALTAAATERSFTGTWKADMQKSSFGNRPPLAEMMVIEQSPAVLKETVGETSRMEYRASYKYNLDGKESANVFRGLPMKSKATLEGGTLAIESHVAGPHPTTIHQKYTLSNGGNTLQIAGTMAENGRETSQTIVFEKQPDAAGEALRRPEKTATETFKNVKLLKDLPASRFFDTMRYFTAALGVNCEFCHVQGHFDSDEKKEKQFARVMITMTHNIDEQTFHGHPEVRCYTCHRGNEKPVSQLPFE
jgi:Photosynthetic reaction centre cytochrome C subunit